MKKLFSYLLIALLLAVGALPLRAQAASGTMYLSANRTTLSAGATVVVAVYMNGGGNPVNAVKTNLTYPSEKLQYVGVSYTGSAFAINTPDNGGSGGVVVIENGSITPVTGSGLIATVTFRALSSNGSGTLGLGGSALIYDNAEVSSSKAGLSLNFSAGAAPAPGGGAKPAAPAAPAPPKDATPAVIKGIGTKGLTPYAASIVWTTDEDADSTVEYGLDTKYGLSVGSATKTKAHELALNSSFLTPKALLHYRVKSIDAAGNVSVSLDQTVQLPGVPVTVVVRGADGDPAVGAEVTMDNQTTTTNSKGEATFYVSLGNKQVVTNVDGIAIRKGVTVNKSEKALPPIELASDKQPADIWMMSTIALAIVVLLLLAFDALMFGSKFFSRIVYRHAFVLHRAHSKHTTASGGKAMDIVSRTPLSASDEQVADPFEAPAKPVPPPGEHHEHKIDIK